MNHIQSVSRKFIWVLNVLLILTVANLIFSFIILGSDWMVALEKMSQNVGLYFDVIQTPGRVIHLSTVNWTFGTKLLALLAYCIEAAPFMLGLLTLKVIFKNYSQGQVFTLKNAKQFRNLGMLFFMDIIAQPLYTLLFTLAATWHNPEGQRTLLVQISPSTIENICYGALIIVISWVMIEASRLNEEQTLTV
jgi:hypothetical protein